MSYFFLADTIADTLFLSFLGRIFIHSSQPSHICNDSFGSFLRVFHLLGKLLLVLHTSQKDESSFRLAGVEGLNEDFFLLGGRSSYGHGASRSRPGDRDLRFILSEEFFDELLNLIYIAYLLFKNSLWTSTRSRTFMLLPLLMPFFIKFPQSASTSISAFARSKHDVPYITPILLHLLSFYRTVTFSSL